MGKRITRRERRHCALCKANSAAWVALGQLL
jgi:hypothetical protein